ncbi:ABC transporter ATP-binding protein [Demequina sp. TTPB684]|uniref:ABC transporter ATP-binding protein n=1 Tax=unclassified Demequina TaxID=2620311 RepID=UPI001CF4894F|nr:MULTISPECIES: ABC transporter ATP-binding protein [unclassified Demequina]MCB2412317.1 ABC transporter ATP-binding protein [Demequina sp. TTPB684]UPU89488.1 ABC transporter ATP-binding protein [Demequina sp. TMPB413]
MTVTSLDTAVVALDGAARRYPTPDGSLAGITDASLTIYPGQFVGVVGTSGSGKSTLLNLVTGIDRPTSGRVHVAGRDVTELDEDQLARWRGAHIGVVFQFPQLIPTLTVAENVMLPMDFLGAVPRKERLDTARDLLDSVGLADHTHKPPGALSGGQQQRVAVARALANGPALIAADEPTGNLDSHTGEMILQLLKDLTGTGTSVLMVTHERGLSHVLDRVVTIADGRIASDA